MFRLQDVTLGGPVFDQAKLRWYNGKYLREVLGADEAARRLHAFLAGQKTELPHDDYFRAVVRLMTPASRCSASSWRNPVLLVRGVPGDREGAGRD